MKSSKLTEEQLIQKKAKKLLIISDWLYTANRQFNITSLDEVKCHTECLVTGVIENADLANQRYDLNDAYYIAEQSKIRLPIDELAIAILKGLGAKKCSKCKEVKPIAEFTFGAKYCRDCRRQYDWLRR